MNYRGTSLNKITSLSRMIRFGIMLVITSIPMGIALGAKPSPGEFSANSSIQNNGLFSPPNQSSEQDSPPDQIETWNPQFEHFSIPDGLPSSSIRTITQDSIGFLWIATLNGLSKFDGYQFTNYQIDPDQPDLLSFVEVNTVYIDLDGDLWIGAPRGLSFYDREAGEFIHYQHDPDDPDSLNPGGVLAILEDSQGVIWVGTNIGLDKFDRESQTFTHYQSYTRTSSIIEDSTGLLWYGTDRGLFKLDPATKILTNYYNFEINIVSSILEDSQGVIWIGTDNGLTRFDPRTEESTHYFYNPDDPNGLSTYIVTDMLQDRSGRFWIATLNGLNIFDPVRESFYHIQHDPSNPSSLSDDLVISLFEDQSGILWIGTVTGGLNKLSEAYNRFNIFPQNLNEFSTESLNQDVSQQDSPQESLLESLSGALITDIFEDENHTFWLGTFFHGLFKVDPDSGAFVRYQFAPDDPGSLSSNVINSILRDQRGELWIATDSGLDRFDPLTETFESISRFDGKSVNVTILVTYGWDHMMVCTTFSAIMMVR